MNQNGEYYSRFNGIERLFGASALERLRRSHVCVVGIGGVGSWAVEALARTGVGALTLVDLDELCVSNINRQLPALTNTVGRSKVAVMKERVLGINPECLVEVREEFFTAATAEQLLAARYDCVLDAIDSVANKCLLIARCRGAGIPVVTAGAAGGRRDPCKLRVADMSSASHDRLLQKARKVLRAEYGFPKNGEEFEVPAVFSPESPLKPEESACDGRLNCDSGYGTVSYVTGAFGFAAASEVIRILLLERAK